MKVDELLPKPTKKTQFKLSFIKTVPSESGCYILTTFAGDILYIGLAINLKIRFKQHLENPEKTKPTPEGKAIWFFYSSYDPKNLEKLERTWHNQFVNTHGKLPLLNKINSPVK